MESLLNFGNNANGKSINTGIFTCIDSLSGRELKIIKIYVIIFSQEGPERRQGTNAVGI